MRWIGGGVDKRNLEQRRQGWYVVKDVPASLVPMVGRKRLRASLKTREHRVALLRRPAALAQLEGVIAKAVNRLHQDGFFAEALEVRQTLESPAVVATMGSHEDRDYEEWTARDMREEIIDEMVRAARAQHHPDIRMLVRVANGEATPIALLVDAWLSEADIEARSKGDHRRAIAELVEWCSVEGLVPSVETFDRRAAGRYVSSLLARKVDRKTVAKRLWSLSALWRWLLAKGHAEASPWGGHMPQGTRSERDKERERPFTDDEVRALLAGTADRTMLDMVAIAALSGMRLEEIALLQVRDIDLEERTMTVREDPKTPSARRVVPIHPTLFPRITARAAKQPADAFVISELGDAPKEGRQRSMAFSKAFGRYRQRVGVHERPEGQRRSLVNFHSLRRWFITKAEHAGQPEHTIRSVVGHKRPGITFGVYSGGASLAQRRACVAAVKLPR